LLRDESHRTQPAAISAASVLRGPFGFEIEYLRPWRPRAHAPPACARADSPRARHRVGHARASSSAIAGEGGQASVYTGRKDVRRNQPRRAAGQPAGAARAPGREVRVRELGL